ncbi:MAG: 5-formyltetrahydrofolate cyclo-ligase [Amphiplicatus sp.]
MFTPISPFLSKKHILREKAKAERRRASEQRPDAALHAARIFMDSIPLSEGAIVSLYYPLTNELDTGPLIEALTERGVVLALPVVNRKDAPLIFRRWAPGDPLVKGRHNAMTPGADAEAVEPDIIVTPLLAFTRDGGRLGYGGGYYDRTIEALRAKKAILAVGYAFGAQQVDALPLAPLDQPLDWIITERGAVQAARAST